MPFFDGFNIEPRRLKLDWRATVTAFFGGNGGGDESFNCSIEFGRPQRPIIIVDTVFSIRVSAIR